MAGINRVEEYTTIEDVCSDLNDLEKYVEDLLRFIPLSLVTINPALKIIDINNSFMATTGYAQYEILSASIDILFKDKQDFHNLLEKIHTIGLTKNNETIILTKEKKEIHVSVTSGIRTDETGSMIGYFFAFIDISDLKKAEQSIQEKLVKLQKSELATLNIMEDLQNTIAALTDAETEIRRKNTELQKINSELYSARQELTILNQNLEIKVKERTADVEKLLKQKDEFITQLGHDLKTPLTPLNILIPIVKDQEQDPKLKELLTVIFNNIQYMKNLVIKTLELAQLNSPNKNFDLQDIDLSSQLNTFLEIEKTLVQGKEVIFENNIPKETIVQADFLQMRELFDNLISNAIKYSQEGDVKIIFNAKQLDDFIVVSVEDTGIGLDSTQIPHVFDEFYKVDYSRHDLQSTGLGLSICKRIVEKHGGKIWVESQGKGKGSTFYFTLKYPKKVNA
ncbi:MAG: PAS domain-containing sensor histidine kinase [Candidatus Thermoplasmatota archaeon]|nr:PAS domain-containing sensor histidine kinase [Candidatus Thermoplasmatota archaeon]